MEDQVLQHEMTDILGKSRDSELGQNPINIACHEKKKKRGKQENIYFPHFMENVYNLTTIPEWDYNETFQN